MCVLDVFTLPWHETKMEEYHCAIRVEVGCEVGRQQHAAGTRAPPFGYGCLMVPAEVSVKSEVARYELIKIKL
jgi:hypothetical protein